MKDSIVAVHLSTKREMMKSNKYMRVGVIGKSGRLDAVGASVFQSSRDKQIGFLSEVDNSSLREKGKVYQGRSDDLKTVEDFVDAFKPDFAIIGPEEPLAAGVADRLIELGVPTVGPTKALAQIESSKSFTRELFDEYRIPGGIRYRKFSSEDGLAAYLRELGEFVIKPDGLTGGKGVKVYGDHFTTFQQGLDYCRDVLASQSVLVVEEKLDGEEFSFQSFCDGEHVVDMVPVQDHKRARELDRGPNTGGMGSYTCEDHSLPFLTADHLRQAHDINRMVVDALQAKVFEKTQVREKYKGILYGSFIRTKTGLKVIEYNARFGDPEALNVLSILKTDFIDICEAIIEGTLDQLPIEFEQKATVCKYVVQNGYPDDGLRGETIDLSKVTPSSNLKTYFGAVKGNDVSRLELCGSRAIGFVGIGDTLRQAEEVAETAASQVIGPVFHRRDIGTRELVQRRVSHMRSLVGGPVLPPRERLRRVG